MDKELVHDDAVANALASVKKLEEEVDRYTKKIQAIEDRADFTGNESQYKVFKESRNKAIELLNKAIERLNKANERLNKANERLDKANERLEKANERLEKANERLEKANERLDKANERLDKANELLDKANVDKANVDKANERLDKAIERLEKAGAHQLQMTEISVQVQAQQEKSQRAQEEMQRHIKDELRTFRVNTPLNNSFKSNTDAVLGNAVLENLREKGQFSTSIPNDEVAFWTMEMQEEANAISVEKDFVEFITPEFNKVLLDCDMIFVNSEKIRWLSRSPLESKTKAFSPDGFATHRGMFRTMQRPSNNNGFRFGDAEKNLYDCLILFECQLTISDAGFGQVVRYLQTLCLEGVACAILFDRKEFWLINSDQTSVQKVVTALWTDNGSKSLFRKFIIENKSPWISRLKEACISLNVDVVEGESFLGRGAFGCVFKVERDKKVFALKIVEAESYARLYDEADALRGVAHTKLAISCIGDVVAIPNGAAVLLSPVGRPLPQPRNKIEVTRVFGLLWMLHEKGVIHGDPHVPNVILNGEEPLWIDLMNIGKSNAALRSCDAEILTRSIFRIPSEFPLYKSLIEPIKAYGIRNSPENLHHLISKVCLELGCVI